MDDLPPPLIVEILSRLTDSDLARCRIASKTLKSLCREVRSINLQCSFDRYVKSRSPFTRSSITPFKTIFRNLISDLKIVESVSIGVEKPLRTVCYDDVDDEDDDLFLTDVGFVREWLPRVGEKLKSFSISDFWVQSCWRRSGLLALISEHCHNLFELEVRNAWLSVDGLKGMPKLTSLTLEFIRLDDENLDKLNDCFPHLQVLNLIGVGGLREPKIHLVQLKSCYWTVSNAPYSVTIKAPNLVSLRLKCVKPRALAIEAPLLSDLHLSLEEAANFKVQEFCNLESLLLQSLDFGNLLCTFPFGRTIKNLTLGSINWEQHCKTTTFSFDLLFSVFPNVSSLTLTPGRWFSESLRDKTQVMENVIFARLSQMKGLKKFTAYIAVQDMELEISFIFWVLQKFPNLTDIELLIHHRADIIATNKLRSRCMVYSSSVRWKWGTWEEGEEEGWM